MSEDHSPDVRVAPSGPPPIPQTLAPAARVEVSAKERRQQREHNHLVNVLATEDGRALVWRILDHCKPYTANDKPGEYQRGIQEGERRVALWLLALIDDVDSFGYAKLIEDNAQRQGRIDALEHAIARNEQVQAAAEESKLGYWDRFVRHIIPSRNATHASIRGK